MKFYNLTSIAWFLTRKLFYIINVGPTVDKNIENIDGGEIALRALILTLIRDNHMAPVPISLVRQIDLFLYKINNDNKKMMIHRSYSPLSYFIIWKSTFLFIYNVTKDKMHMYEFCFNGS
jgi:hypothetical protein